MKSGYKNRKLRLEGYDYSTDGIYFLTTCVKNRAQVLGTIKNRELILSDFGAIAEGQLLWLPKQYPYVRLRGHVVMPDHVHVLLEINRRLTDIPCKIKPVPELMGAFKTTASKLIHREGLAEFSWQRSYHDRIVRVGDRLVPYQNYIRDNPKNWKG